MKKWLISIPLLVLSCTIEDQFTSIRPGATYIVHSGDYDGIEWTDKNTTKPTRQEMSAALSACQLSLVQETASIEQAKQDAINNSKTDHERLIALTKYLGLVK